MSLESSAGTTAGQTRSEIYDFSTLFPDATDYEKSQIVKVMIDAGNMLAPFEDEAYVPEKTVEEVKACLKINHGIKWRVSSYVRPKDRPSDPPKLIHHTLVDQHMGCPGGKECRASNKVKEEAQTYMETQGTLDSDIGWMRIE
jgi:hypothetical protein